MQHTEISLIKIINNFRNVAVNKQFKLIKKYSIQQKFLDSLFSRRISILKCAELKKTFFVMMLVAYPCILFSTASKELFDMSISDLKH